MQRRMSRVLALFAAIAVLSFGSPAWADDEKTININPGNLNTLAGPYAKQCEAKFGGGPYVGKDVWVFNLPAEGDPDGFFVSVTATFTKPGGGTVVLTIPTAADSGINNEGGSSKAWIITPAGWTLTAGSAVINGTADQFVLTHTCVATPGNETPTPDPSESEPVTPTPGTPTPGVSGDPSTSPAAGGLPLTGTAVTGLVTAAAVFIAAGAGLMLVQRRRKLDDAA